MPRSKQETPIEPHQVEEMNDGSGANPNQRLVDLVRFRLRELKLTERWLCEAMGVTQVYWRAIANGGRPIVGLPKEKLAVIAELLQMPVVQVYALGGKFSAEDFLVTKDLERQLHASWAKMRADPEWLHLAPSDDDWASTPRPVLVALVSMYERLSAQDLLSSVQVETRKR